MKNNNTDWVETVQEIKGRLVRLANDENFSSFPEIQDSGEGKTIIHNLQKMAGYQWKPGIDKSCLSTNNDVFICFASSKTHEK